MGFVNDGSVHWSGIANEENTAKILNEMKYFDDDVIPIGGTTHKEDAVAGNIKLSIKDKKKLSTGSFDWANISASNKFGSHFGPFFDKVKKIRSDDFVVRKGLVDSIRTEFSSLCSDAFGHLSKKQVCDIVIKSVSHNIDYVFVNDQENKSLLQFDPKNHPAINIAETCDSIRFDTPQGAKSSRKIIFIKDGVDYDYGLRLRITSNNGINAMLDVGKGKNRNSYLTIKLQQDSVKKLLQDQIACKEISYG